jgi:mersacidin/lichenicidin family type 2 lantibiotic
MSTEMAIRSWKDPMYRSELSAAECATLPLNPAGLVELSDAELMELTGGTSPLCLIVTVISIVIIVTTVDPSCITGPTQCGQS